MRRRDSRLPLPRLRAPHNETNIRVGPLVNLRPVIHQRHPRKGCPMRIAAVLLVAFACSGAFASEPGQPLDCSDWVFLEPGLTCAP
jgi:hypothetical protein